MARAGINKALVQEACAALINRGQHPSIDAVRIELGNTGSKTTISNYLKELQAAQVAPSTTRERINAAILHTVETLTQQLEEESSQALQLARAEFAQVQEHLETTQQRTQQELYNLQETVDALKLQLDEECREQEQLKQQLATVSTQTQLLLGENQALAIQVNEKTVQIDQLTKMHTHARDVLEHFREQSRLNHEQLISQHEQQTQQLNAEVRRLHGEYMKSQDTLVQLNRENARLIETLNVEQHKGHEQQRQCRTLKQQLTNLHNRHEQLQGIKTLLSEQLVETQHSLLSVSNDFEQLKAEQVSGRERTNNPDP